MNGQQYFGENVQPVVIIDDPAQDMNDPVVNPEPHTDNVPVEPAPIHETPMGGTTAVVGPTDEMLIHEAHGIEPVTQVPIAANAAASTALLSHEESERFRTRWNEIQGMFVDEPRSAVQQADGVVSEVIDQITQMFAKEHHTLEEQWKQGNDVSTEDLRKALQRYRSFFNRLVV